MCVFDWLRNLLFTPKRAQIAELEGWVADLDGRIKALEMGKLANKRWEDKADQDAEFAAFCAEVQTLMTGEKKMPLVEALKTAGLKNPVFAVRFLQNPKKFIKLPGL
jgi:hypothetical protein